METNATSVSTPPRQVLRDYQERAIESLRAGIRRGRRRLLLVSPTGCHTRGQRVLMFDGSTKPVEQVEPDDILMGPDSMPRMVLGLCRGVGMMNCIWPTKGNMFIVNDDHVLSLMRTNDGTPKAGTVQDISVREYLASSKTFKHVHKLFRVGVDYMCDDQPLPLDPYFLGVLLGDGDISGAIGVCKPDLEIREVVEQQAQKFGLWVVSQGEGTSTVYRLSGAKSTTNPIAAILRDLGVYSCNSATKHIPVPYMLADRESRLQLLAGLMDTDGSLSNGGYDFISKSRALSDDVERLARSLGIAAYVAICEKSCQTGAVGTYFRVSISGCLDAVPCRIPRKQASPRQQVKDVLRTGFRVEPIDHDAYFGFTLSGDGRYLLDDFTVTHNSGKTTIAAAMIDAAVAKGKRIVFLAHRKELIDQCSARLAGLGVQHGIIMADHPARRPWLPVHVASVQTLVRRETETPPDLVFVDECHRARARTYESILSRWPGAVVIGLTATPVRSDGKGLGSLFEEMVLCPSVAELTTMGHLVPTRVFAPSKPDLAGVKLTGGDYNQQQLSMIMDKPTITGDIVAHWLRLGEQRITVLFAVDVEHNKHLRDQFLQAGVRAAHLDGETPVREREGLLADLAAGRIRVLCSVGVLTEGWDCPVASCAVLVRPTKSMGLYLQMAGRILRPAPDKSDALILDHAGCTLAHGLVDEEREWSLDGDTRRKRDGAIDTALSIRVCPKCYAVYGPTVRECACGYVFAVRRERPRHEPGDLQEVTGKRKGYLLMGEDRRREMYMRWAAEVHEKGYKPGYPLARYRAMFGVPPPMEWQLEASLRVKRIAQEGEWRAAR